ncbi:MAG: diaminopropionate ammonia-lyase [Pseudomonadota bacterium]
MQLQLNQTPYFNPHKTFGFADESIAREVAEFHGSLPEYSPTPCPSLDTLAKSLGLGKIAIKDENHRFDLHAFKVLGASYAVAKLLAGRLELGHEALTFDLIHKHRSEFKDTVLVTATDGNHGRAVAWSAKQFGCQSVVYMPQGTEPERLDAIKAFGADAAILDCSYDSCVSHAARMAKQHDWLLVQDTAWPGYEDIPLTIQQGYFTLLSEALEQSDWPTHIFVQAGVGSLPAGLFALAASLSAKRVRPKLIVVEPKGAPCLFRSIQSSDGSSVTVEGKLDTIMAGLACGTPSAIALDVLRQATDAFIECDDDVTKLGMRTLANPLGNDAHVVSGESGAVTLGVVIELMQHHADFAKQIDLGEDSQILLFSTEGATAPSLYRSIVGQ